MSRWFRVLFCSSLVARVAVAAEIDIRLEKTIVPNVSFDQVGLQRAIAALSVSTQQNLVVVDPENLAPSLTIELHDLPLRRVLDLIAESVGFQVEVREDAAVLRPGTGPGSLISAYLPVSRATVTVITGLGAATPAAESEALRSFLRQAGVSFDPAGSNLAYDGTGAIVTHTPLEVDRIRRILGRYGTVRQVEIEARFVEVRQGALDELGISWNGMRGGPENPPEIYDTGGSSRSLARAFSGAQSESAITINGVRVAGTQPPRLPGEVSLGDSAAPLATVRAAIGEFDVNAVIRALSQKQGTDLLSAPRVTVLSGHTATITVAQEMRYPQSYGEIQSQVGSTAGGGSGGSGSAGVTITAGTPQDFAMRKVGVELRCTPVVESDGTSITLDLNPRVTEFERFVEYGGPSLAISAGTSVTVPPGFYQPVFSVREVATRVTLREGTTLVMGGLTRDEVKEVDDRVPVLGSLPLVGRLFRSKAKSSEKRNLLIFVTAKLVP